MTRNSNKKKHPGNGAKTESEKKYRALADNTLDVIYQLDRNGIVTYCSPSVKKMLGYTDKEVAGSTYTKFHTKEGLPKARRLMAGVLRGKTLSRFPFHLLCKNGSRLAVEMTAAPLIEHGRIIGLQGLIRDMTDTADAKKALKETEARFTAIMDNSPLYIFILDKDRVAYANKATLEVFGGRKLDDILGRPITELMPPEYRQLVRDRIKKRLTANPSLPVVHLKLRGQKGRPPQDVAMQSLLIRSGGKKHIAVFGVDISGIKNAENRLKESERLYKTLAESIPDYIYLLDRAGRVTYRNRYLSQFGSDPLGKRQEEIFPLETAKRHLKTIKRVLFTGEPSRRVEHLDYGGLRDEVYMENRLIPVTDETGRRDRLLGITRDITPHIKLEDALRKSNAELALFSEMDSILLRCHGYDMYSEMTGLFTRTFPADCGLFGYIDENGDCVTPHLPAHLMRAYGIKTTPARFKTGRNKPFFFTGTKDHGRPVRLKSPRGLPGECAKMREAVSVTILFNRKPLGFITLGRKSAGFSGPDLERLGRLAQHLAPILNARLEKQRQEAENQRMITEFLNAQKIESLGVIAGGIAHDFNNMLAGIMGNLSLLGMDVPEGKRDWREMISEAIEATENARHLARQLINFSKCGTPGVKKLNFSELIRKAALFAVRGSNCAPKFDIQNGLWSVTGDETQLVQAIHNLVINSVQATPKGGEVVITAVNETGTGPHSGSARSVKLSVRDNGAGIPPENRNKIFKPFFSTKAGGRGLGLTMARTIIKRHAGRLVLQSMPGQGACFEIYLPAASGSGKTSAATPGLKIRKGSGKVLLMEDDHGLARSLVRMLRRLGYTPVTVCAGEKALKTYADAERAGCSFRAVIMDLVIPGAMGGEETVRKLKALYPGAKVILSSGHPETPVMSDYAAYGFDAILPKPYKLEVLAKTLSKLLAERSADK